MAVTSDHHPDPGVSSRPAGRNEDGVGTRVEMYNYFLPSPEACFIPI